MVILAVLVREGGGEQDCQAILAILLRLLARLLAILLLPLAPLAPLACRLVYLLETKIARLLGNPPPLPCNLGPNGKLVSETKIARLLRNLAQVIVLNSRYTVLVRKSITNISSRKLLY